MFIVLDTFPASSSAKLPGKQPTMLDDCRQWLDDCETARHTLLVPAVAYYEALRELEVREASIQIQRLKAYCLHPDTVLRKAAPEGEPLLLPIVALSGS